MHRVILVSIFSTCFVFQLLFFKMSFCWVFLNF
jgi:hypothetical protein